MSLFRKFMLPSAVACTLFMALGVSVVSSNAAQLGVQPAAVQPVGVRPTFDKNLMRAPNPTTPRTVGIINNLNKTKISKGVSPDG